MTPEEALLAQLTVQLLVGLYPCTVTSDATRASAIRDALRIACDVISASRCK